MGNDIGYASRRKTWTPAPRPEWVRRINEEGAAMDIRSVVPLDENSLLTCARANTGLDDFGADDWREPFSILVRSLDEEANLNLLGRLMCRSDLLTCLEQRLRIEDTYRRYPEIEEEQITKPLFVIGQGRSGTSVLLNILSQDPENNALHNWASMFPCPPPEKATYKTDPRIPRADKLITQVNRVVPEIVGMHEFRGEVPIEDDHLQCLSFRSIWFPSFYGQAASYSAYLARQDSTLKYAYEKRVLKLLQWKNPCRTWVLKMPSAMIDVPNIIKVFPDVCFVWPHRDPVKALSSMVDIVGTMLWARSDSSITDSGLDRFISADANAQAMGMAIDWIESGVLPREKLFSMQYQDFVRDPLAVVQRIYDHFSIPLSDAARDAMARYMAENPRSSRPPHNYHLGDAEQIAMERKAYARYQSYFNVPNEV